MSTPNTGEYENVTEITPKNISKKAKVARFIFGCYEPFVSSRKSEDPRGITAKKVKPTVNMPKCLRHDSVNDYTSELAEITELTEKSCDGTLRVDDRGLSPAVTGRMSQQEVSGIRSVDALDCVTSNLDNISNTISGSQHGSKQIFLDVEPPESDVVMPSSQDDKYQVNQTTISKLGLQSMQSMQLTVPLRSLQMSKICHLQPLCHKSDTQILRNVEPPKIGDVQKPGFQIYDDKCQINPQIIKVGMQPIHTMKLGIHSRSLPIRLNATSDNAQTSAVFSELPSYEVADVLFMKSTLKHEEPRREQLERAGKISACKHNCEARFNDLERGMLRLQNELRELNEKVRQPEHRHITNIAPRILKCPAAMVDDYPGDWYVPSHLQETSKAHVNLRSVTQREHALDESPGLSFSHQNVDTDPSECRIFRAVRQSNRFVLEREIDHGVNPNIVHHGTPSLIKDPCLTHHIRMSGYGLLHVAVCHSNVAMITELLDLGCRVNMLDHTHRTPLFLACVVDRLDVVELLIQAGGDVNQESSSKKTPLRLAVTNKNIRLVALLIDAGCDVNAADATGCTALYIASMLAGNDTRIMQMLIAGNADVNQANRMGATPLHIAVQARQRNAVYVLVKSGVDVNQGDRKGRRALHSAYPGKQYLDLICLLAWYGADLHAAENSGKRVIDYATESGNALAIKFIVMCDCDYNKSILTGPLVHKVCHIYPEFYDWLQQERTQPKSLLCACRQTIRRLLSPGNLNKMRRLDIPRILQSFLALKYEITEFSRSTFSLRQRLERPHDLGAGLVAPYRR